MLYRFGEYELDECRRRLRCSGRVVPVTAMTFDLLVYLIRHRRRVVEHDELFAALRTIRARGYRFVAKVSATRVPGAVDEIERLLSDAERDLEDAIERGEGELREAIRRFVLICRVAMQAGREADGAR